MHPMGLLDSCPVAVGFTSGDRIGVRLPSGSLYVFKSLSELRGFLADIESGLFAGNVAASSGHPG